MFESNLIRSLNHECLIAPQSSFWSGDSFFAEYPYAVNASDLTQSILDFDDELLLKFQRDAYAFLCMMHDRGFV